MTMEKKFLIHWSVWFYLGHVLLFWLIGCNYFSAVSGLNGLVLLGFFGHLAVLALAPCLAMLPIIFLFPHRRIIFAIAVFIAALGSSFLLIDTIVYKLYHYHLNRAVLTLAYHGITQGHLGLSFREKVTPIAIIAAFFVMEFLYAKWLWRAVKSIDTLKGWFKYIAVMAGLLIYFAYIMIVIQMNPAGLRSYIEKTRFLPFYVHALSVLMPKDKESLALIRIDHKDPLALLTMNAPLNYPKHALHFNNPPAPLNLVIIGIDSWRFDMLNAETTPNILDFSKKAWVFEHHMSGGNSTGPGIFSLFYGLPASYTEAMENQHRAPILMEALKDHHYQIGVFSSAPLDMPPINLSVFQYIENENSLGDTVLLRDRWVTKRFADFVKNRNRQKPFFTFLFFDAAHSYCGTDDIPGPFQPIVDRCDRTTFEKGRDYQHYLNRYKNAVLSVDQEVNQVLATLQASHLLDDTVVMIVGDHGEEFDDGNKGYYGHASNFGRYQIQTPLIIYWPGQKPEHFSHATSHFDIVPTLMKKLLGCSNKISDYSVGYDLLNKTSRPYFIVSSYVNLGIVEPDRITTIHSAGNYDVENKNGDEIEEGTINLTTMRKVFDELHYYFHS